MVAALRIELYALLCWVFRAEWMMSIWQATYSIACCGPGQHSSHGPSDSAGVWTRWTSGSYPSSNEWGSPSEFLTLLQYGCGVMYTQITSSELEWDLLCCSSLNDLMNAVLLGYLVAPTWLICFLNKPTLQTNRPLPPWCIWNQFRYAVPSSLLRTWIMSSSWNVQVIVVGAPAHRLKVVKEFGIDATVSIDEVYIYNLSMYIAVN